MSDFISELDKYDVTPRIEFCKTQEDAKLPKHCGSDNLFILFAADDYVLRTWSHVDAGTGIDTGIQIKSAKNVEVTVFAPMWRNFDYRMIEKQSEIHVKLGDVNQLIFYADQLFRKEFCESQESALVIHKGDPICYLKVSPVSQILVGGVE